jgi:hypothetical protein
MALCDWYGAKEMNTKTIEGIAFDSERAPQMRGHNFHWLEIPHTFLLAHFLGLNQINFSRLV